MLLNFFESINSVAASVSAFFFLFGHAADVESREPVPYSSAAGCADQTCSVQGAIRVLCGLALDGNLFGIDTSLAAQTPQFSSAHPCCLNHGCQLDGSSPLRWRSVCSRQQLPLSLQGAAPVVDGLRCDFGVACDFSHALSVRRAHPQADGSPPSGVIGRLHSRRLGPQVVGSNRALLTQGRCDDKC
jgi:hypothetical protein